MTSSTLGQRIAAKRSELGLSQSALGEHLGVSRQSVFKWESDAAIPEIDKLIALSRLFGVTLDWLMGIGDSAPAKEDPPGDFTHRERQILEQLAHQRPAAPRWQKWLTIGAAVCAALALVNSCISLHQSTRVNARMEALQTWVEEFSAYVPGQFMAQADVVQDHSYECVPALDMSSADVQFRIKPYDYQERHEAAVLVLLGGEVMGVYDCRWNGASWETELILDPANGYQFLFRLTDENGNEFTQGLNGEVMEDLAYNLAWPMDHSVTWEDLEVQSGRFAFTDMRVEIPLPGVFRPMEDLWERCDLVLSDDAGNELYRFDLMHRSAYSAGIDFGGSDVDFTTRSVEMAFSVPAPGTTLQMNLDCMLTTGHQFFCPVETWKVTDTGITAHFAEPRA